MHISASSAWWCFSKSLLPYRSSTVGELALQDRDQKVARPARWLEEAGVDPLGLVLHQVEHRLDQPCGSEHLPVVSDASLRLIRFKNGLYNNKHPHYHQKLSLRLTGRPTFFVS